MDSYIICIMRVPVNTHTRARGRVKMIIFTTA